MPSVSVVVPVLNAARTLAGTLDALARLRPPPLEILLVDNGSVDGSRELLKAFVAGRAGGKASLIVEPRRGASAARNAGIRAARGEVVAFTDADCLPDAAWLEHLALPFADASFDLVTTGYGIRNVPVIDLAIAEIARVLRPGGTLLSLDFNRPVNALVRGVYLGYLAIVGSTLGFLLHRDPDTYRYIPESIKRYPGAAGVCRIAREQGFVSCEYIPVLGGLMAIHVARR